MNKELSIKRQKEAGTYDRNLIIKAGYLKGCGQIIANKEGITRQRVWQIVRSPSLSDTAQDGKLGHSRGWLRDCIGRVRKLWHNSREL